MIDRLIQEKGIRIQNVFFDEGLDLVLFLLNNRSLIQCQLSAFPTLYNAPPEKRSAFRITPFGVHWDELDEDIGLKGLLEEEMFERLKRDPVAKESPP
jgi:hypothetical protein